MNKLVLGVDVDGVLANFNRGFAELLIKLTGKKLVEPLTINPQVWDWPEAAGYKSLEVNIAWKYVMQDPHFWSDLLPLSGTKEFLSELFFSDHDVYFVTARPGLTAKQQTEQWLCAAGYGLTPTVLITSHKGLAARTLHLDAYMDDRRENCIDVATTGARVYMLKAGYNNGEKPEGVTVISSVLDMLEAEHISARKVA